MTSENQFIIEDVDDHGKLEFYNREIYGSNVRYFSVNLDCPNLKASTNVYSYEDDANRLALLFQEMNENWRGWEGKKEWSSLGGECYLGFTCDSLGHITILVELRREASDPKWILESRIQTEVGQLDTLSKEAKKFFIP